MSSPLRLSLLLVLAFGCDDDTPAPGPVELAVDARLGALVMEGSPLRELSFASFYVGDQIYVVVHQAAGPDETLGMDVAAELRFFAVDDVSLTVTEHAAPPVAVVGSFVPSVDVDGTGLALATRVLGEPTEIAFWGGAAWTSVPAPPAMELDMLVSRGSGRLVARAGTRAFLFDGDAWIEAALPTDVVDVRVGPWDAEGFHLVYVTSDHVATQRYSGTDAAVRGDPILAQGDFRGLMGSAVNGDTSSFQLATGSAETGGLSLLFEDGALAVVGRVGPGAFFPAPGSDTVLFARGDDAARGLTFHEAGAPSDIALYPFRPHLGCACVRPEDPACDCVDRAPSRIDYAGAPTADRLAMTQIDDVEGTRALYVRVVDLPTVVSPFLDRDAECVPTCEVVGEAYECVVDTHGAAQCVPEGTVADGGLLDAGPTPFDAGELYGATLTGTYALSDERGAPVVVEVEAMSAGAELDVRYGDGSDFAIPCTPDAQYRITIRSVDAHRPIVLEATSPALGETLHLGDFTLIVGEPLGPAWGETTIAPTALVSPVDGTMIVVGEDAWYVIAPPAAARGFLATRVEGAPGLSAAAVADGVTAPRLVETRDPDLFFAETATGFVGIRLADPRVIGAIDDALDLSAIDFAESAPVALIARRGTGPVIVRWEDDALDVYRAIDAAGEEDWLDPSGARLLRVESGVVVEYDLAADARAEVLAMGTGRFMRLGNGDLVGIKQPGMPGLGTCPTDDAGCEATVIRADGMATQTLTAVHGFAPSTTSAFLFYTTRAAGGVVPHRFSLAGGSVPVMGLMFSDVAFAWLTEGDVVAFQDDIGYRVLDIATGALVHTEPGAFTARQHHDGTIVLTPSPCGADCDLIFLDAPAGTTRRIANGGGAVFLGPDLTTEIRAMEDVALGARTVARAANAGDELASPAPTPFHHQGAPCWPYSWRERGVANVPAGRVLYCAR